LLNESFFEEAQLSSMNDATAGRNLGVEINFGAHSLLEAGSTFPILYLREKGVFFVDRL